MKRMGMIFLAMTAVVAMGGGSCDDEGRLAEYAHNSVEQQNRQNEQIARQNLEVTRQNRQVADAAQKLVEADARARQELVIAQKALQEGLQSERSTLDRQRDAIEQERRDLAQERQRDPVIAEAVTAFGMLLACLLPLMVCVYLLRGLHKDCGDEAELNELLVSELTSARPLLLPVGDETRLVLEQDSPADIPPDPDESSEPPF